MTKGLYVETYGCQMNVRDSRQIVALLKEEGYSEVSDPKLADVIVINTCTVREKAAQKVMSRLGRLLGLKKRKEDLIIVLAGCLAQQRGESILKRMAHLDLVIGTHQIRHLPTLIRKVRYTGAPLIELSFSTGLYCYPEAPLPEDKEPCAFVTIMQGCNNFCTYCVVPYVRGPEESRPAEEILAEIRCLVEKGVREVTLLGQNVNSYGQTLTDGITFPQLLERICEIEGLERIRFTTSHPKDLSEELMACFARLPKLCPHIHLPFQSGSNKILRLMNRGYTREEYIEKIVHLRNICPHIAITADVMVGFPGETEEDFCATLDLMEKIRFDNLFSFKYSRREGTYAANMVDDVPAEVKAERLTILQKKQEAHTWEKHQALVGEKVEVLVEGRSKNSLMDATGRTPTNKIVNFPASEDQYGKLVTVKITQAFLHSLRGEIIE
ncbi:MAG: tRNA (N6-isopentenyl adenosine(37)-C2)-methylthiotransferase MiaB [Syntrophales bacterium]|nr:tRNA (N6-isopentenyl adenosine(37)-C2)-methylthiotransferase MiaB [Syntrophales bacterium]